MRESREWNESEALLFTVRIDLGIDLEGGTQPESFEWASRRDMAVRMEMLRQCDEHERVVCWRNWPLIFRRVLIELYRFIIMEKLVK